MSSRQYFLVALALLVNQTVFGGVLTLNFYDTNGTAMTFEQVQATQVGHGRDAHEADAFVDPTSLRLITATPMTDAGGLSFQLPRRRAAAFAINWPTATQGYGLVILDHGGNGFRESTTVNFTYQAAKDTLRRLEAALKERPDYHRSAAFDAAYQAATNHLGVTDGSSDEPLKGARGQLALDQLVVAYDLLLKEYGPVYARAHQATTKPWLGFTIEEISHYQADLDRIADMTGDLGWARIVFDAGKGPSNYVAVVDYAKAKGIHVLGLPVDSSADTNYTRAQYLERYTNFIAAFPSIETWEVGNEVNGGWSSADIGERVADVAAYCKAHGKKTYLTLFWQLNTADREFSMFNWIAAKLPPAVRADLDYVGVSQYQEQAPVGAAFDQVMRRLRAEFPKQQIGLGELGYWIPDQQYWWAYDPNVKTAKQKVFEQYYKASLGYAGSYGGGFWWNFAAGGEDYDFDSAMADSVAGIRKSLSATNVPAAGSP